VNNIEIKHLRMLCAIAATGSMTKAAGKLCVSQSALSQQLKDIEGKLNVDLFFRARRRMLLTPIGSQLLETARQVVALVDDAELEIARRVSGERGELKVGTQCIFCFKWLPRVMRAFQRKFPNIEVEIGHCQDLARELETKAYDLIVTAVPLQDDQFGHSPLFEDQMVCIMPEGHPLSAGESVAFSDFRRFTLLLLNEKGRNRFYQQVLKPRGVEPSRFMTVGQPNAVIEMVASGFGISVFPRWAVADALAPSGITARPLAGGLPVTWYAAYLKNRQTPVFQQELIHIIRKMDIESAVPETRRVSAL